MSPELIHPALWRGGLPAVVQGRRLSTGFAPLDECLFGGWPLGGLTEIRYRCEGIGELGLLLPALAAVSRTDRWIVWGAPPYLPYPPALAAGHIRLSRLLLIESGGGNEFLWALEQSLQSGECGAVLFWQGAHTSGQWQRLQRAAERGGAWAVWLHQDHAEPVFTPAVRLGLEPGPEATLSVQILKRRGGWPTGPVVIRPGNAFCQL